MGHLNDAVQLFESIGGGYQNAPPNHRADFQEPDLQPQDGGSRGFRRLGGRAARHKQVPGSFVRGSLTP
jgi:hypothetical protein